MLILTILPFQPTNPLSAAERVLHPPHSILFWRPSVPVPGIYVLGFCRQRGLPTKGIRILERPHRNQMTGMVEQIELEIQVPASFPEKYRPSLIKLAELCAVKKHLEHPPHFDVFVKSSE